MKVERHLDSVQVQYAQLSEAHRRSKVESWQQQFFSLENINALTKFETEKLLKVINNPPVELKESERQSLQLIESKLISHIDQMKTLSHYLAKYSNGVIFLRHDYRCRNRAISKENQ